MTYIELIFHNSRSAAVEDLLRWYHEDDVELIELVDYGRTLRLYRSGAEPDYTPPEPVQDPGVQDVVSEPVTPVQDLSAPAVDLSGATRDELRQIVVDNALEVTIPSSGPLGPVRDAVAEALASKE